MLRIISKLLTSKKEEREHQTVRRASQAAQTTEDQRLRLLQLELDTLTRKDGAHEH